MPLLRGRLFNEQDTKDSPRVIIIDQAMAEQYFPGEDPIGKRLGVSAGNDDEGWVMSEIVGVDSAYAVSRDRRNGALACDLLLDGAGATDDPWSFRAFEHGHRVAE